MNTHIDRLNGRLPDRPTRRRGAAARRAGWLMAALALLGGGGISATPPPESPEEATVAGFPAAEAMRLGERLYREGILPSGEYVQATVQGDLPVDGRAFHCMGCHQRSGLGSSDGNLVKLPITGPLLYKPYPREQAILRSKREDIPEVFRVGDVRPAYTHETLARAIREGISPAGVSLHEAMPRYVLGDREMALLIYYLDHLNRQLSPGVDEKTIRFATVISEEVPAADRQAMLAVLQAYVDDRNSQSRDEEKRSAKGSFEMEQMYMAYRRLGLDVWELKGAPDTWRGQLEAYYRQAPVFALLGGISTLDWRPIHEFCEENKIPCIFPLTDFPVISEHDWYTLYLSRGLYQEGETAARYLAAPGAGASPPLVVQVYRDGRKEARLSGAFRETWNALKFAAPAEVRIEAGQAADAAFWKELYRKWPEATFVAWLAAGDLEAASVPGDEPGRPRKIIASSSLLGGDRPEIPPGIRSITFLTYPYSPPQEKQRTRFAIEAWLRAKKIPFSHPIIQSDMYFLSWMMTMAFMEMKSWFYRDYFMETFDMSRDQDYNVAAYPRVSFGFGQRYAAKGCYVVQLTDATPPALVKKSEWVIH